MVFSSESRREVEFFLMSTESGGGGNGVVLRFERAEKKGRGELGREGETEGKGNVLERTRRRALDLGMGSGGRSRVLREKRSEVSSLVRGTNQARRKGRRRERTRDSP